MLFAIQKQRDFYFGIFYPAPNSQGLKVNNKRNKVVARHRLFEAY